MAEDDFSNVVGGPEEIGFKSTFVDLQCIRVSDGQREGVPEGRGGDGEGSVPQGAVLGPVGWGEKVGISGEWGSGEWRWRKSVMHPCKGAKLFSAL